MHPQSSPPPIRCVRRPGDFGRRSVTLLQAGTTTCCCCCLHWLGAAAGGLWGFRRAVQTPDGQPVENLDTRTAVRNVFIAAFLATFPLLGLLVFASAAYRMTEPVWVAVAVIPSLFFVPAGLAAMGYGWWKSYREQRLPTEQGKPAFEFGCRLAWMSLVWAMNGMIVGYLVMLLMVFFGPYFKR